MYNEMLLYVKKYLEQNNAIRSSNPLFTFRNRYEHITRVFKWCMVLLKDYPQCKSEVVLVSAIFHDVGYSFGKNNHAENSVKIFKEYAINKGMDECFIEDVCYSISHHSDKSLLKNPSIPIELTILLEADLLDEEGALGILWDLMSEGAKKPNSYNQGLECMYEHSAHILNQDYMVTPIAKEIWSKKQKLVSYFIEELNSDLFIDKEE